MLTGLGERDGELVFCSSEHVLDLVGKDLGAYSVFCFVEASESVGESDSVSEPSRDLGGDGGRGTLVGVRLNQFMLMASEGFVGVAGDVELQSAERSKSRDILSRA